MNLIISLLVGALAGWLADKIFGRFSFPLWVQLVLGLLGGLVGGWVLGADLETVLGIPSPISRLLTSLLGAVIILGLAALLKRSKS